ncbi:gonadotropin-releasing hormone receptor-like isoform X1 [Daphnia pulex]|uniref:gonadotropin-releasing hormone receptor-like isoform X1 n=1 Tax=Daphnia pulex TaxID=6669 RepID=UPI001EE0D98C|nr:gonadotropin-releasing hormone receptor-like isoform X1 [Daphnia pulex]XP_046458102.1 gonadotropin-releasing hormone receptor-like isoform X1 [Daphnia pulex]
MTAFINQSDPNILIPYVITSKDFRENSSLLEEAPTLTTSASVKATVLCVMAVASLIGNLATLISIAVSKKGTSSSLYTLLFQLAISDLLVSVWCLSGEAAWTYTVEWKGGQFLCKTFKFSQVFSLYLSTSTMVLIGFDRLRAIRRPISHRSCLKPICVAWILSAVLASPQLLIFRVLRGPFRELFYQCVTYGFYTEEWQEQLYTVFSLLTMFVIPLIVLIGCYVCIFCTIAIEKERAFVIRAPHPSMERWPAESTVSHFRTRDQQHRQHSPQRYQHTSFNRRRNNIFKRAKMKSLRISIIIVTAFVICWAPYYFMMITFIFLNPDDKLGEDMQSAIFFFGMSNSLVNPLIYGAFHLWQPNIGRSRKLPGSFSTAFTDSVRAGLIVGQRRRTAEPAADNAVEVHPEPVDSASIHMTHKHCSLHRQNRPHPCRYRTSTTSF